MSKIIRHHKPGPPFRLATPFPQIQPANLSQHRQGFCIVAALHSQERQALRGKALPANPARLPPAVLKQETGRTLSRSDFKTSG